MLIQHSCPQTNDIKITWCPKDLTPGRASELADQALVPDVTFCSSALVCVFAALSVCLCPEGVNQLRYLLLLGRHGWLTQDLPFPRGSVTIDTRATNGAYFVCRRVVFPTQCPGYEY